MTIEIQTSELFWQTALGVEVEQSLDEWRQRGWVIAAGDRPDLIQVAGSTWPALAIAGKQLEDESARELAAHSESLCRLAGIPSCRVLIRSTSFLGAATSRFEIQTIQAAHVDGGHLIRRGHCPQHPDVSWMLERVAAQPDRSSLDSQIRLLAELRQAAGAIDRWGDGRITIEFDEHLAGFQIASPSLIGLQWLPTDEAGKTWSLGATIPSTGEEGPVELPLSGLAPSDPLLKVGPKQYVLVDPETAATLRRARNELQRRREVDVIPFVADPSIVVPEGASTTGLDFSEYGSRVLGFAPVVKVGRPVDIRSSGARWFDAAGAAGPFMILELPSASGGAPVISLALARPEDAFELRNALRLALSKPHPSVLTVQGVRVIPTPALFHKLDTELDQYVQQITPAAAQPPPPATVPRLGVKLDDNDAPDREAPDLTADLRTALDKVLRPDVDLKKHQRIGLAWLWSHYTAGSPGVLLADEMGLGKTLQIAAFLGLQRAVAAAGVRPALVVAPVLLLENWADELSKFLAPEAFAPLLVLHGAGLGGLRRADGSLDLDPIRRSNVVLTNYDTLDRHQLSLLKVDWRTVVLDESQQIKNPDTLRSKAARALKRDFAICSTGTPVENRLLDLWTHFDFLSPVQPLGTMPEFKERFEPDGAPQPKAVARALAYPSAKSLVLRRTKDQELDLPPKRILVRRTAMTADQHRIEQRIVRGDGRATKPNVLEVLNQLRSLYQHPWLLRRSLFGVADDTVPPDLQAICDASPKMSLTLDILEDVANAREKALIFSPWAKAQQLLVRALKLKFGLRARVVNGESNQRSQSMTYIREFSGTQGFNVLVLSPIAAGAGLNIVAANHVIHYGRWWNPAKEDQATDRAYRIGQTRPVSVHYPILHHPADQDGGFDVQLHGLVERKRELAKDFLSPDGDVTNSDLEEVLFRSEQGIR